MFLHQAWAWCHDIAVRELCQASAVVALHRAVRISMHDAAINSCMYRYLEQVLKVPQITQPTIELCCCCSPTLYLLIQATSQALHFLGQSPYLLLLAIHLLDDHKHSHGQ